MEPVCLVLSIGKVAKCPHLMKSLRRNKQSLLKSWCITSKSLHRGGTVCVLPTCMFTVVKSPWLEMHPLVSKSKKIIGYNPSAAIHCSSFLSFPFPWACFFLSHMTMHMYLLWIVFCVFYLRELSLSFDLYLDFDFESEVFFCYASSMIILGLFKNWMKILFSFNFFYFWEN